MKAPTPKVPAARSREIEDLAQQVIDLHKVAAYPVDLGAMAARENIVLAPDYYGPDFSARIEYHHSVRRFIIFHPLLEPPAQVPRVRFSIAHEFGHFYLPTHAQALRRGLSHTSQSGFVCNEKMEREADEFAASLLIPKKALGQEFARRKRLSAPAAVELAAHFLVSLECAAIRCVRWGEEAACLVVSFGGVPRYCIASDEAFARGLHQGALAARVPPMSATARALAGEGVREARADAQEWFPTSWAAQDCWEEVIVRDGSLKSITFLFLDPD